MPTLLHLLERCTFPPLDHVWCAVSGGADSLALMILAVNSGRSVTAVHVDHGLRPGSNHDVAVVSEVADRLGVIVRVEKVTVESGPNLEARARHARHHVLPAGTLLGHTADDQAETVLLNLVRGSGLRGLAGMDRDRRPILGLRRSETRALCAEFGVDPVHDETNDDWAFRRNRVRGELLPLIDLIAERDVVPVLARNADLIRSDDELLVALAAEIDVTDARALSNAPLPLARRAVRQWLRQGSDDEMHPPTLGVVDRVLEVARGDVRSTEVGGGRIVSRTSQRLSLKGPVAI